ncbi:MAG TPA: DUF6449 domain-containing protein, partial [Lachnospiraceae bacterium]|nr:DUF6449 domain-containing protein [Lachnospiraceae bacterium]
MTLRSLFFKLQIEDMKRRLWALALAAVVFFFTIPVACAISIEQWKDYARYDSKVDVVGNSVMRFIGSSNTFLILVTIVGAIICGISGYSYLHSKKKIDFYHSLPVKRETLFSVYFFDGILIYLIPYVCSLILCLVIVSFNDLMSSKVLLEAVVSLGINLLNYLAIYTVVIIAVLLTGQFFISVLACAVFFIYGPAVVFINDVLHQEYFQTFYSHGSFEDNGLFTRLSPITWYIEMTTNKRFDHLKASSVLIFIVIILALIALSAYIYRKRASETAGKAVTIKFLQPIIKTLISIPVGLLGGQFFKGLSYGAETFWLIFGMICGYLLSSIVIEMIYHFDFRAAFKNKIQLLIGGVLMVAIFAIFRWDVLGYDRYVPDKEDVKSMCVKFNSVDQAFDSTYRVMEGDDYIYMDGTEYALKNMTLTDIDIAYKLAKLGANRSSQSIENDASDVGTFNSTFIYVKYRLKSGREVIRQYDVYDKDLFDMVNEIYSMREYKEGSYPLYNMKSLLAINCSKDYMYSENLTLTKEESNYLIGTYQDEFGALSLYDIKEKEPIADITFNTEYSSYTYF